MDVPPTQIGATDVLQDRETCLQLARLLGQPDQRTAAIAELLFSVWQDVRRFDSLALDGVEPAVTFSAAWD
ncbi:MAG TPA: hypothetical protein VHB98_20020 [Chloroflexota bacterium]|jgi:hypothetical protein|nr:hypothetical protein [Chloroflexota bacterium]